MPGTPGVTTICKTTLSGSTPEQIRDHTDGFAPAQLRELAIGLAEDPDLTVSVVTYNDGRRELEVLHTGPRITPRTPSIAAGSPADLMRHRRGHCPSPPPGLQDAMALVRGILLADADRLPAPVRASSAVMVSWPAQTQ
jgi:hypothetical protein